MAELNPWTDNFQKLALAVKCPCCLNLLTQPMLLPCDHIFCNHCVPRSPQLGSECPSCKHQYVDQEIRAAPHMSSMVAIYKSLDATFSANALQSLSPPTFGVNALQQTCPPEIIANSNCKMEHHITESPSVAQPKPVSDQHLLKGSVCAFCHSSKTTEGTGPFLYYENGREVVGNVTSHSKVICVHKKCFDWTPQVFYDGDTVKNLETEVTRAAKLKCSSCGVKGAALGCYVKSCRRSYHVPCAFEIKDCQWDMDDFLMLCPVHKSVKFPIQKSKSRKLFRREMHRETSPLTTEQLSFWAKSSDVPKEWVLSGSALSSEEKFMLVNFANMCGAIAKVLTERLKKVIAKLVDKHQMAFIKGRQIMDAVLVANECVDSRLKSKKPGVLCKLDIEKAYDHVNWNFLFGLLQSMGFGTKWINWVKYCVTTVKFSVLINGNPEDFFPSFRGLRQGDPLSPFLFLLVMEGLNSMLREANLKGWIKGYQVANRQDTNMEITHLMYADDTLILCDADEQQLRYLRIILVIYEASSGLHVNWRKSLIYPVNEVPGILDLSDILGGVVGQLPTIYLGMPLAARSKAKSIWNAVLEKCEKRLSRWNSQYLSMGGRLTLINSVLDALPTYMMSLYPVPINIINKMDVLRRKFLWHGKKEKKGFNLVNWKTVTKTKREGGLGIKNLKHQNNSLLMKWLWRYNNEPQALWKQVIREKYGEDGNWTTRNVSSTYGVSIWRSIRTYWPYFFSNVTIKVGDGRMVSFWNDIWLGQASLKVLFPDIYALNQQQEGTIQELWSSQGWNLTFRRQMHDWEIQRMAQFLCVLEQFKGLERKVDRLWWKGQKEGRFSVKTAYRSYNQFVQLIRWPWKHIWRVKIPYKVNCFVWLVSRGAVLTQDNLIKRGIQLCSRCHLCGKAAETINHLFIHCVVTDQLWKMFINMKGICWTMPESPIEVLKCWNSFKGDATQKRRWKIVPGCIWWSIWKERNLRCFEDGENPVQKIKMNTLSLFLFWCKEDVATDIDAI